MSQREIVRPRRKVCRKPPPHRGPYPPSEERRRPSLVRPLTDGMFQSGSHGSRTSPTSDVSTGDSRSYYHRLPQVPRHRPPLLGPTPRPHPTTSPTKHLLKREGQRFGILSFFKRRKGRREDQRREDQRREGGLVLDFHKQTK